MLSITGEIVVVADNNQFYAIHNGRKEMPKVIGTRCMLYRIMAAFFVTNAENKITVAAADTCIKWISGEIWVIRKKDLVGNSALRSYIIDALYNMDWKSLDKIGKYEMM